MKAMGREIRSWHLARRSDKSLDDLARMFNSIVQGWINYYGRFYRSRLLYFLRRLNDHLVRWACRKYKAAAHAASGARWNCWPRSPGGLPGCSRTGGSARVLTAGRWEPDESRGSSPVLREPGGAIPPATHLVVMCRDPGAGRSRAGPADSVVG